MLLKFAYETFIADCKFKNTKGTFGTIREGKVYSYSVVVDHDILGKIANWVFKNHLYIEHELYTSIKSLDRPNTTIHQEIVCKNNDCLVSVLEEASLFRIHLSFPRCNVKVKNTCGNIYIIYIINGKNKKEVSLWSY